jgi:hypothetical protein
MAFIPHFISSLPPPLKLAPSNWALTVVIWWLWIHSLQTLGSQFWICPLPLHHLPSDQSMHSIPIRHVDINSRAEPFHTVQSKYTLVPWIIPWHYIVDNIPADIQWIIHYIRCKQSTGQYLVHEKHMSAYPTFNITFWCYQIWRINSL